MSQGLHYEVLQSPEVVDGNKHVYRLKIVTSLATYGDSAVFRYRKEPVQPGSDTNVIMCDGVCSPLDLTHLPIFDSNASSDPPYFRLDYVDFVFTALSTMLEVRDMLIEELNTLNAVMDQLELLEVSMSGDIGTPLSDGSSSSSVSGE